MNVDELSLLRKLITDEPVDAEVARAEVWRRLSEGETAESGHRGGRRRIAIVLVAAAVVVVAAASAFATFSELVFDPSKPRKESRTVDDVEFTFNVPGNTGSYSSGWQNHSDPEDNVFISKSFGVLGQHAQAVIYWSAFPDGGIATPCSNLLRQGVGESTYALAAAMARAPGVSVVRRPLRTTVGGRSATHVVLKVREDRGCDPGYFFTWRPRTLADSGGALWVGTGVGDTIRVWVISVAGRRLVVAAETERPPPGLHPHARAEWTRAEREIESIVQSIRFR